VAIYTKKGDKGKSGLLGKNKRFSKDTTVFNAIGAIDELNSYLGVVVSESKDSKLSDKLEKVQNNLLRISSIIVGGKLRFYSAQTRKLEKEIDEMESNLPTLKNFIIPGGSKVGAKLHIARSIARRAERNVVGLSKEKSVKLQILAYLNRLSDYLFMLARHVNFEAGQKEKIWKK
jgi:cob(I)alamin adenosyltransferase